MAHAIPIIRLDQSDAAVAAAIGDAARGIGFFYIAEHGVPAALRAAVFVAAAGFFAQPAAVKAEVSITRSRHNRGYVAEGGESLDPSKPADVKEAFNIGRELAADDPDLLAGRPFCGPNLWPDDPAFRAVLLDNYAAMHALSLRLHRAFATDIGLDAAFFDDKLRHPLSTLRLLHYRPHPGAFDGQAHGAGTHTDYGDVTILAQDDVGGLEVRSRDGTWLPATPVAGAYVCNIGDCLMRWSNDTYVSTPHRVVNRSGRERYSVAYFCDPDGDADVSCLPSCTGPGRPALYPPTTGAAYLRERLDATYAFRREPG